MHHPSLYIFMMLFLKRLHLFYFLLFALTNIACFDNQLEIGALLHIMVLALKVISTIIAVIRLKLRLRTDVG